VAISVLRLDMRSPSYTPERRSALYGAALEMAAYADEKGFDSISVSEHHATDDGFLSSPIAFAGCLLGRTRRLRVVVVALLLPLYDPVKLAEDMAILDLASGGRFAVTAGIGYRPEEYAMFGRDWKGRGRLMDEGLEMLVRAWSGEPFEHAGRRGRLSPPPLTQPLPPVMVGGASKRGARRAARFGLPFQPSVNTPEVLQEYRDECERLGVAHPLLLPPGSGESIFVSEDPDRSWSEIGAHLLHDAMVYASWQPAGQRSAVHSDATSVEALRAEGRYRILTPDECVERARERGPFTDFVHFPLCGGTPPELAWRSLELYAEKVLPRIAGGSGAVG
jgi:alkanesulfonate monooxygenase SsuD/methylene tetrahydromethanopterin reductase-like flavin-dependent oxidoreductase (luciferase family)